MNRYPQILYKRNNPKFSFWFGMFILLVGIFLIFVSLNVYVPHIIPSGFRILSLKDKKTILFLGIDEVYNENHFTTNGWDSWKGRSDTIAVLHCDPINNAINLLSIPRDTRIAIGGSDIEKINYLNAKEGPKQTKKYVEELLNVRIDHFVAINLHGLGRIIDEIGGIVVNVPQRMYYVDHTAMLNINLFPGKQLLNGDEAVDFVRFRFDSLGDIGRIQRQQMFMKILLKKLLDPVVFARLPQIAKVYKHTVQTSMNPKDVIEVANFIRNVPDKSVNSAILPGKFGELNGVSYWIPVKKETQDIVRNFFYK